MQDVLKALGIKQPTPVRPEITLVGGKSESPGSDLEDKIFSSSTAVVYQEYASVSAIPELKDVEYTQGNGQWTRFVCISDTHSRTFPVPDGDVLLHSGDLTNTGRFSEFKQTMDWLYTLPHKVKIIVAGNHDLTLHRDWYDNHFSRWHRAKEENYEGIADMLRGKKAKKAGIVYLESEAYTFSLGQGRRDWSVYGSPWSPWFQNWAYNYKPDDDKNRDAGENRGDDEDDSDDTDDDDKDALTASEIVSSITPSEILLTHGPPFGVFDFTLNACFAGCPTLLSHLSSGRLRPRLHLFGHIHEAHGSIIHDWEVSDAPSAPPIAQNAYFDQRSDALGEEPHFKDVRDMAEALSAVDREGARDDDAQRTVFVNAANWPMGSVPRGTRFAGPGFRPIVVDLKD
ncbi:Metallo-dependent phosphatase-like protein [Coprinopsis sp. MPI-PUGE-AT-0042]|nr:Metallo-dependent phosphatase-like protein [Coprinopsis sp. MPI-PUGE-AT-0042]